MAILKFKCYCSPFEQVDFKHMEKVVTSDKCEGLPSKPPLLPKPKIILPPRRNFRKTQVLVDTQTKILIEKTPEVYQHQEVEIPATADTPVTVSETANITDNIQLEESTSQEDNFRRVCDSLVQTFTSHPSLQLNDSDLSSLYCTDGDKESDSDLTDSASQRSLEATLSTTVHNGLCETEAYLIASELASTELAYIEALRLIVNRLKEFIDEYSVRTGNACVIPDYELAKITSSLPQLLSLNEDLHNDLQYRVDNWKEHPKIADVIVKKGPFLKLYTTYIKEFETVCSYLDECRTKYPKFSDALKEFESLPICKSLNLKHYMLKPVQRIPQYRLLLQNYLGQVKEGSEEHADATKALQIIQQVLTHTNDTLNLDNLSKLLQIQSNLCSYEIIKPGRKFIKEGELYKLSRKDMQLRFFILLSDCLLYITYVTLSTLKVKNELPLLGMKVQTNCTEKYEFSIITSTRSFSLRARNCEEYHEWVTLLQKAIEENNQRQLTFAAVKPIESSISQGCLKLGQQAPVWIQDKRTTMCQVCTAEFTVTFRRHHCRSCGKVVCSKCSNNRAPLAYLKFQSARVCKICFDNLLKEMKDYDNIFLDIVKLELGMNETDAVQRIKDLLLNSFKKYDCTEKTKKFIPQRLKEVPGDDLGDVTTSGWLMRRGRRGWKRMWFVLKARVLYEYKASHDVVAHRSLPVLGYTVSRLPSNYHEECDTSLAFSLNHPGQTSLVFAATSADSCEMWVSALSQATILE